MIVTPGKLMLDQALPDEMKNRRLELTSGNIKKLMQEVAEKYPDKYKDILQGLMDVSKDSMFTSGGYSFSLKDIMPSRTFTTFRNKLNKEIYKIVTNPKLSDKEKQIKVIDATSRDRDAITKQVYDESLAEGNPLALQIHSGTKGKPFNLLSLKGGDLLYVDHHDRPIPMPVLNSYSVGLSPAEYWAGTYGTRKSIIDLKLATRDAGAFSKQLMQAAHRLIVTKHDDEENKHDPESPKGYPVSVLDNDNEGALLAHKVGPYTRDTIISPKVLAHMRQLGHDRILVRSPIVGGPPDGGVYSRDVGIRERGTLTPLNEFAGTTAAMAIGMPISQGQICLSKGTLVRMADWSSKPIEEIKVNDLVMGADDRGKLFPVKVVRTYDNGLRECYETIFKSDHSHKAADIVVTSTKAHKILSTTQSITNRADDELYINTYPIGTDGSFFAAIRPTGFIDSGLNLRSEPMALLVGLVLGDGCYTKAVQNVNFSCADKLLLSDLKEPMAKLNLSINHHKGTPYYYGVRQINQIKAKRNSDRGTFLPGARNPIKRWLEDRGMFGKYAHEKSLPPDVDTWDNDSVAQLLAGLYITDGSVFVVNKNKKISKPHISFGSTSHDLSAGVARLLAYRFGIYVSGPHMQFAPGNKHGRRPMYKVDINTDMGVAKFAHCIPLLGVKKVLLDRLMNKWQPKHKCTINRLLRRKYVSKGMLPTYDLEVDSCHHLFLLSSGIVVANSSKHLGGIAGQTGGITGFKAINQMVQVPKVFPGGATHAQVDGEVQSIDEAPGGGLNIIINNEPHYAPIGLTPKVKRGDTIEAGDALTDGLVNPREVTQHKHIGEGRRAFVDAFRQVSQDAGYNSHRRNIELMARALINHVQLTDEMGHYLPDDIVPYSIIEHDYKPRADSNVSTPHAALGKYLEKPVLHYTIGTKVRPSVVKELKDFGVKRVTSHPEPPPFEPHMVRAMDNLSYDPDWMTRLLGSHLEKGLLGAAHRGGTSDEKGTSYVPGLAKGVDFGKISPIKGYDVNELKKSQRSTRDLILKG